MQILVTGGAGFVGSHLVRALIDDGHDVRVLDNLSTGKRQNLTGMLVELIEGDVADWEVVQTAVSNCDLVFHLAALVSVPQSIKEPQLNHDSNVTGTFNVFEAARLAGVRRVVYASSAAVYGNLPNLPKKESDPLAPITPYAMAKRFSEQLAAVYAQSYGMEFVGLRYMNIFGPCQDPSSPYSGVLSIFCRNALAGKQLYIHGDGEQTRDFVYVADVVQANLLAATTSLESGETTPASSRGQAVFNIGRGQQTSLNQIIEAIGQILGQPIETEHQESRAGDIRHSVADITLARTKLGFEPKMSIKEGLKTTLEWFRMENSI